MKLWPKGGPLKNHPEVFPGEPGPLRKEHTFYLPLSPRTSPAPGGLLPLPHGRQEQKTRILAPGPSPAPRSFLPLLPITGEAPASGGGEGSSDSSAPGRAVLLFPPRPELPAEGAQSSAAGGHSGPVPAGLRPFCPAFCPLSCFSEGTRQPGGPANSAGVGDVPHDEKRQFTRPGNPAVHPPLPAPEAGGLQAADDDACFPAPVCSSTLGCDRSLRGFCLLPDCCHPSF